MDVSKGVALIEPTVDAECLTTEVHWQIRASLPFLASALQRAGYSCRVFCEELVDLDRRLDAVARDFGAVGISVTVNTVLRALEVARALKARHPALPVIFGGVVAAHFAPALLAVGDWCVTGRGEVVLPRLLRALGGAGDPRAVPGVIGRGQGGELVSTEPTDESADHPSDFAAVEGYGGRSERRNLFGLRKTPQHSLFSSTGCVNRCRFCMTERRYRTRRLENVVLDLRQLLAADRTTRKPKVMLVDDCPFGDRDALAALLRAMAEVQRERPFSLIMQFHVKPLLEDPELVALLVAAGTKMLLIGFETVSDESLASQGKGTTLAQNLEAIGVCRRAGVVPYGYFVVGFETDTPAVVRSVFDCIVEQRLVAQVLPVGITEGAPGARGTELTMPTLDPYSFGATVFVSHRHPAMAPADLQRLLNEGYERIFSLGRVLAVPTFFERTVQLGFWMAHRRWRPRLRAHVEQLAALESP